MELQSITDLARVVIPRKCRNWIRSPSRTADWLLGALQYAVGKRTQVSVIPNWSVICHPIAFRFGLLPLIQDPSQRLELISFSNCCRPKMVFFDIGAHFGFFTLAAVRFGGAGTRVLAVDPSPVARKIFRYQQDLNAVQDDVAFVQAAVSDRPGEQSMIPAGVLASGYFTIPESSHTASESVRTRSVSVDSLVKEHGLTPTHMKIDVEGGELEVLQGAESTLEHAGPAFIFLELHVEILKSRGFDYRPVLTTLRRHGYTLVHHDGTAIADQQIGNLPIIRLLAKKQPI